MGDVAWLTGSSLAAAGGLIAWMVRWVLTRERELRRELREEIEYERGISRQWRTVAEMRQADDRRRDEILVNVLESQQRMATSLDRLLAATAPQGGWSGSPGYDASRPPQHARPPTR